MRCGKCSGGYSIGSLPFGLAWGISFAIIMALIAWAGWLWGYGNEMIAQVSNVYSGYEASFVGGLWGALWGFLEGFIMGFLTALFYNLFRGCSHCLCRRKGDACECGPECKCCGGKSKTSP